MFLTNSILVDIRTALGIPNTPDFDIDLLMHINASIGTLNQNGVGKNLIVTDTTATWADLQESENGSLNDLYKSVPLFIMLNTKLLFDPPPPSSVQYHQSQVDQLLWRLKIAYEK